MNGQASRLIELQRLQNDEARSGVGQYIAFVSGKGGTGKSFLALNTAYALSINGDKVLLIDFDLQNPNLHILANTYPTVSLQNYFAGSALLEECLTPLSNNLFCIYGEQVTGFETQPSKIQNFFRSLERISRNFDYVIFDSGSGIHESLTETMNYIRSAIIVANPEPTSVMDAYVMTKYLVQSGFNITPSVIINKCANFEDGQRAYQNLGKALRHFLREQVELLSIMPTHNDIYQSIMNQELLIKDKMDTPIRELMISIAGKLKAKQKAAKG